MERVVDSLFNPFARDEVGRSPGAYASLRAADPVHWSAEACSWIVTRYADAGAVLRDPAFAAVDLRSSVARLARRAGRSFPHLDRLFAATLFFNPTESHPALRRLLARALNAQPLSRLVPVVNSIAAELWQAACQRGGFDAVADLAEPLPARVMAHLLGVPETDLPWLLGKTRGGLEAFNRACSLKTYEAVDARCGEVLAFLGDLLRSRRVAPRDDGMTRLAHLAEEGGLDDRDVAALALFLCVAGIESTTSFISGALLTLLRHPDELARLRSRAVPMERAVEELLRYESPVPRVGRVAQQIRVFGARHIKTGDTVIVLIDAANSDPEAFIDPERLDLGRMGPPHLSFAEGGHSCLGASLARLEARSVFEGLLAMPPLRLVDAPLSWWPFDVVKRLRRLEVAFA